MSWYFKQLLDKNLLFCLTPRCIDIQGRNCSLIHGTSPTDDIKVNSSHKKNKMTFLSSEQKIKYLLELIQCVQSQWLFPL